jgi:cytoskeletal protein CcmA (bactofilin family)
MARQDRDPYSYVDAGTRVEGLLVVEGRLRVDGVVRGEVRASGVVEVAPGGRIEGGPLRAAEVRVAGEVRADVLAEGRVEIWRDARLEGDVRAAALDVEEGARFLGRSLMHEPGDAPGEAEAAATPPDGARDAAPVEAEPAGPAAEPTPLAAADLDGERG